MPAGPQIQIEIYKLKMLMVMRIVQFTFALWTKKRISLWKPT
jgi:hypothetical protein